MQIQVRWPCRWPALIVPGRFVCVAQTPLHPVPPQEMDSCLYIARSDERDMNVRRREDIVYGRQKSARVKPPRGKAGQDRGGRLATVTDAPSVFLNSVCSCPTFLDSLQQDEAYSRATLDAPVADALENNIEAPQRQNQQDQQTPQQAATSAASPRSSLSVPTASTIAARSVVRFRPCHDSRAHGKGVRAVCSTSVPCASHPFSRCASLPPTAV